MPLPRRWKDSAEVVVIGGGAMGASIAYHLSVLGITDVVLLERDVLASGSTSKAAGGVRMQFSDEANVRIMLRSVPAFERFEDELGADIGFHQVGYLFLLSSEADVEKFETALELQRSLGVPSRRLDAAEAAAMSPLASTEGLLGGAFCPLDGYATPEALVQAYAGAAASAGVAIAQSCEVTDIKAAGERITAVETSAGMISTSTVICAAGVGSRAVGQMVGYDLPVTGVPHWLHYSAEPQGFEADAPLTIDYGTGIYLHREGPGLLVGGRERHLDDLAEQATQRFPGLVEMQVASSWWGHYEMSPDCNALVGRHPENPGFLYATGFSGHGFMQAPAIGEHVAELVSGAKPTLDLEALAVERFSRQSDRREAFVV